jgi:hypothetical protein
MGTPMSLYEKEEVRAAAVQAAAQMLGDLSYYRRDVPGGGFEWIPSPAYKELTDRVASYIARGRWEIDVG